MIVCRRCGAKFPNKRLLYFHKKLCKAEIGLRRRRPTKEVIDSWRNISTSLEGMDLTPDVGVMPILEKTCIICGKLIETKDFDKITCSKKCERKLEESKLKVLLEGE